MGISKVAAPVRLSAQGEAFRVRRLSLKTLETPCSGAALQWSSTASAVFHREEKPRENRGEACDYGETVLPTAVPEMTVFSDIHGLSVTSKGGYMKKKTVRDVELKGKRVLMRADFNVPLDENLNITG